MIGTVLGNRYELLEKVGVGGMAVVYKATDRLLNRHVAVKLLRSEFQGNEEFIRRFNIESQAAASLSHPNIVSIYDVGQSEEMHYIVMEFIEGKTLKEYIAEKKGDIYWKEATDIAMQICSALEHAHSKHIIHRDIKPQNIMINTENVIKVTDFGIARAASGGTLTMEAMGSAHYLSPEQARGGYTDQRSDIYSFGVLLYELYTGKPCKIKEDLPKSIESIILKAMSKEQRLRYESAGAMLSDIKKAYTDPEVTLGGEIEDDDKFGTKKITPIVNITIPTDSSQGKNVVRRNDEDRKKKKKDNKKDVIAVVAAIATCIVVAITMGVIVANVLRGPAEVEVFHMPHVKGMTEHEMTESLKELREEGFEIEEIYEYDRNVAKGEVIDQEPKMGQIDKGVKIVITISSGKEKINLDDYTNAPMEEAIDALEAMGLVVKTSQEMSDEIEEGKVIRQLPSTGHVLETGDSIRLFVSSGPNKFALDNYVGSELNEAKAELELQGVEVTVTEEHNSSVPKGIIINQSPAPNTEMMKGGKVTLTVSLGVEIIKVPNLMDLTVDAAKDALTNNKLKIGSVTEISSGKAKGLIVKQSVAPETPVEANSVVDVWVSKGVETAPVVNNSPDAVGGDNGSAAANTSDTGL